MKLTPAPHRLSLVLLFCLLHYLFIPQAQAATAVDVALNKPITAEITCGTTNTGPETYFPHSEIYLRPSSRTLRTCFNGSSHPASAMLDGNPATWWQSTDRGQIISAGYGLNGLPEAVITMDLEQYFEVDHIDIKMGDSKRPGHMILYKSVDGIRYVPWIYRVTTEQDCTYVYQIPVRATPRDLSSRICNSYVNQYPAANFEKVQFDLSAVDPSLAAWRNLRYLKIEFYHMDLTLGINGVKFQHYTVSQIAVFAECVCNGQAEACSVGDTGQYECVCGGNTNGLFCEACQPFFNQFPFFYGSQCEPCNCFGHADSCFYDLVTANFSRSLDSQGVYRGGGVCNDCQNNTAGVNCNQCKPYHYRPLGVDQQSGNPCLPCNCNGPGVEVNPVTGLTGDCVMNDDTLLPLGMVPGDCVCKANVTGSKCDRCKVGFYELDASKPSGCTDCACNTVGTVSGSPVCNSTNGQCPCKPLVMGRHCEHCLPAHYGMTAGDTNGCKACACDHGGSLTDICAEEDGQCPCRANIGTQQCNKPLPGSYSPDPHFLHGEFESIRGSWARALPGYMGFGYSLLSETVAGLTYINIPSNINGQFYLLLRYETAANVTGEAFIFASGVPTVSTDVHFAECHNKWCYLRVGHDRDATFTFLGGRTYTIRVSTADKLKLDQAVVLPWEFTNGTNPLGPDVAQRFQSTCNVITNDMRIGTIDEEFCLSSLFSLTSHYLGGALPCDCHYLGSAGNGTCDSYGGQCPCQPGVGGRRCDDCLLENFNLQEGGCQPCGCGSDYKVCDSVTGHCVCPPNIVGRKCDSCMVNHWNWTAAHGCEPCECNPIGSASLQCNATSGVCRCKRGVATPKCHLCQDGFKSFSWTGCVPCDCDMAGSLSDVCNKRSGQCECKDNAMGRQCQRCKGGTYYLNADHHLGCLQCVCMGITSSCSSSSWRMKMSIIPVGASGTNNRTINFDVVTEKETVIMELRIVDMSGLQMAQATVGSQPRQYWAPVEGLRGNLLPLFENQVHFTVKYTADDPNGLPLENNKVIIISNYRSRKFYLNVPVVPYGVKTVLNVTVTDENLVDTSENITRGEFLLGLQDVQMVLIPASYYDRMHTSMIGDIHYQVAAPDGDGPPALSTESCNCPAGYEGQSCERCAPGYMRKDVNTHEYLGVCRPCECHNHATECDPDTGHCTNCKHNTDGPFCEVCATGYYGSADMGTPYDCMPCPCYEPRVANGTCLVARGTISCLYCAPGYTGALCDKCDTFYFGNPELITFGKCEPCFCNDNTDKCDSKTGVCIDCQHDTSGPHCEHCSDGFYGNASSQNCLACECVLSGSHSEVCDHVTGQCDCFAGVGGRTCDACLPDYYGYTNNSFEGCVPCECNPFGSADTQCNDAGVCTCRPNSEGDKCTTCSSGYWGLPNQTCEVCGCDATGSVDPAAPCDSVSGQCDCKPGVAARQCDVCQFLHVGFGPEGCTACNECQFSMGNDTAAVAAMFNGYWSQVQMIGEVQTLDSEMQILAEKIAVTSTDLGLSEGRLDFLTDGLRNLTDAEPGHNQTVQNILDQAHTLEDQADLTDNSSQTELSRQEALRDVAKTAHQGATQVNTTSPGIVAKLTSYKMAADQLHIDSSQSSSGMDVDFASDRAEIATTVENITAVADDVAEMLTDAEATGNLTTHLQNLTSHAENQLNDLHTQIEAFTVLMYEVKVRADVVADSFNTTKYYRSHAEALFTEAQTLVSMAETILADSTASYREASQLLEDSTGILHGVSSGSLPIDTSIMGHEKLLEEEGENRIWSWTQASTKLDADLATTLTLIRSRQTEVSNMEARAEELSAHVQALVQEFERVKPAGELAVEAIAKYEAVAQTLQQSVSLALEANRTVGSVMDTLRGMSIAALEATAAQSVTESQKLVMEIRRQQVASEDLWQQLLTANATLTAAVTQWQNRYELSEVFLKAAAAIHELAKDTNSGLERDKPLVAEPIEDAYIASDEAIQTADAVLAQDGFLQTGVGQQARKASLIREENNNATGLISEIGQQLDTFQEVVQGDLQAKISTAQTIHNDTSLLRARVEAQMASIEATVARALARLTAMEQPVGFTAGQYEAVENPAANTVPHMYDEIRLDFQVAFEPRGLLLFMENNRTTEQLQLHLKGSLLTFTFNNGAEVNEVVSRADICGGCWFRVIATRYEIDGHLTVIRLKDGATTSAHYRSRSKDDRITLNSPLYLGGLPPNYVTDKVSSEDGQFAGCLTNIYIGGTKIKLWAKILNHASNAQCCGRTPPPPRPRTVPGFALSGFGYYQMPAVNVSIVTSSRVQFRFRTFDTSGVIMVIDRRQASAYYGLYLVEGKVMLKLGGAGWEESLISSRTYSDGQWYQLTSSHNATSIMVVIEYVDKSVSPIVEVKSGSRSGRTLDNLQDGTVIFGSQNPSVESHAPVRDYFAGCMSDVKFARPGGTALLDVDVPGIADTYGSVSSKYCYEQVTSGLSFTEPTSYARLSNIRKAISVVQFLFQTYEPSGILMFAQRPEGTAPYFYIAVFNGDLFVLFNQGAGPQPVLRTRGLYLSDGREHDVFIDFSYQNNPRLTVNGEVHHGAIQMTPNMAIMGGPIYLGGVPPTVRLPGQGPVSTSLIGGFRNLQINTKLIDLYSPVQLDIRFQTAAWLSGLPLTPNSPPPLPYSTTPAPPTTPHPTCAMPYELTFSRTGMRFGESAESYIGFDISRYSGLFTHSFTITVEFRAVQPNGILVYAAGTADPNPTHYFALFLENGHLVFNMDSNSVNSNANPSLTKRIMSRYTYDTGQWVEATVLRINDFIALVVTANRDYKNNGVQSTSSSMLDIQTPFYVGGVPASYQGMPFRDPHEIPMGNTPFHGCIRMVKVATHSPEPVTFDLPNPDVKLGTLPCFDNVQPGIFLNATDAYIRLQKSNGPLVHNVVPNFRFNVTLHGTTREGTLLVTYQSFRSFFLVEMFEGQIRGILSDGGDISQPFIFTSAQLLGPFALCDNLPHTIDIRLGFEAAEMHIDDLSPMLFRYPTGFLFTPIYSNPIYVGGQRDPAWVFPIEVTRTSFHGCMSKFYMDGEIYVLAEMDDKSGAFSGCPAGPMFGD